MSSAQRIKSILAGAFQILLCVILLSFPEYGLNIAALILSASLAIYGIRTLIYYFRMARHMVGGRVMLYIGVIVLDFGFFTMALSNIPKIYIALYLVAIYAFSGVVDILHCVEQKKYDSISWINNLITGVFKILIAVASVVFLNSTMILVYIFSFGLASSGVLKIITAFRRTAIVYIQ